MTADECEFEVAELVASYALDGSAAGSCIGYSICFIGFKAALVPDLPVDVKYGGSKSRPTGSDSVG